MANPGEANEVELEVTFQLVWPENAGNRAVAVNQVVFAWDQSYTDMVYMHLGHAATPPPRWVNLDVMQKRLADAAEGSGIELAVEPVGSFVLSRPRALELYRALGKHLGINQ